MYSPIHDQLSREAAGSHHGLFHSHNHCQHHHSHTLMTPIGSIGHHHHPGHYVILPRSMNGQDNGGQKQNNGVIQTKPIYSSSSTTESLPTPSLPSASSSSPSSSSVANSVSSSTVPSVQSMDKSPMCLINELARCNSISHQYHLVEECGPPHEKTFTVVLKLGDTEEYRASGPSIRKAQRSAATLALEQTKFIHPPEKTTKINKKPPHKSPWPLTPTVELNVLAMRRCETAIYQVVEPPRMQPTHNPTFHFAGGPGSVHPSMTSPYDYRGMHYQRYHMPRGLYTATVTIGGRQFVGRGKTSQAAKHAAAEEALKVLRELPIEKPATVDGPNPAAGDSGDSKEMNGDSGLKSPISLVHEIALKRGLSVQFEVVSQTGPSHLPTFFTRCIVGELITEGEGNGKKISKKNAAEMMLKELQKLEPLPQLQAQEIQTPEQEAAVQRTKQRKKQYVKKKKNIIKDTENNSPNENDPNNQAEGGLKKEENNSTATIHPINRLIQLQQAKKEREPTFTTIDEIKSNRRREFKIECSVVVGSGSSTEILKAIGTGPNKKIAKKNAAESMLHQLGYSSAKTCNSLSGSSKSEIVDSNSNQKRSRKVKFVDDLITRPCGRQLVPGLILMPAETHQTITTSSDDCQQTTNEIKSNEKISPTSLSVASHLAKELLEASKSLTTTNKTGNNYEPSTKENISTENLRHLEEKVGNEILQVHYSDFPKKTNTDKIEYLSVVTITLQNSVSAPIVSHGIGRSQEEARNQAAYQAMLVLSKLT